MAQVVSKVLEVLPGKKNGTIYHSLSWLQNMYVSHCDALQNFGEIHLQEAYVKQKIRK